MHTREVQQHADLERELPDSAVPEQCSVAALDCMDMAVFVVDGELHLLHANAAATQLLERDTALRRHGDKLLQESAGVGKSLARMVHTAVDQVNGEASLQALCLPRRGRQPLLLTVAPFLPLEDLSWQQPCAIVMAGDPEAHRLSREVLRQLFDLTPAEAGVAQALAHGEALEDIAMALDVSLHTVKTHLQKLFRKTGTRRQGELVAMLHGTPAATVRGYPFG